MAIAGVIKVNIVLTQLGNGSKKEEAPPCHIAILESGVRVGMPKGLLLPLFRICSPQGTSPPGLQGTIKVW